MCKSKILVTGANGFVGAMLCARLYHDGISFVAAVRKRDAPDQIRIGDITSDTDWTLALSGCDVVIHLAARVHVMHDKSSNPLAAFRAMNVDATLNLARQAVDRGVKRFIFMSSIKVNGEETTGRLPYSSGDKPAPVDFYGKSKLEAEAALLELSRTTGLEVVIIRPPLVYGPGVKANFHRLMQLVKLGIPLPFGAIRNRRSLVSVFNLVDLLIKCVDHPDARGQIFLISDGHDVSTAELIHMLAQCMRKRLLLLPVPIVLLSVIATTVGKSAAVNRAVGSLQVDIRHTELILGWRPVIQMQEAVQKTVESFLSPH